MHARVARINRQVADFIKISSKQATRMARRRCRHGTLHGEMRTARRGGGWAAIAYTLRMARKVGWRNLVTSMRAKNACKTCALGMGGQKGGMVNELGRWPEVCKKSFQAMVADMQGAISADFFDRYSIAQLRALSSRELEWCGRLTTPVIASPGDSHYRAIDWETAFARIAAQLKSSGPGHTFFYASGRSSNE